MPFQSSALRRAAEVPLGEAGLTGHGFFLFPPICLPFRIITLDDNPNQGSSQPSKPPLVRGSSSKSVHSPDPYSLGVLRVVAIRIEPKATTEARVVADSVFGSVL